MPEATVMVADHDQRHSPPDAKRAWTLTRMQDGNGAWYSTFKKEHAVAILGLKGKKADITYVEGEKGRDLTSIVEHFEPKKNQGGGEYQREMSPATARRVSILNTIGSAAATVNAEARDNGLTLDVAERWRRTQILAVQMMDFAFELAEKDPANDPFEDDGIPFGDDDLDAPDPSDRSSNPSRFQ